MTTASDHGDICVLLAGVHNETGSFREGTRSRLHGYTCSRLYAGGAGFLLS